MAEGTNEVGLAQRVDKYTHGRLVEEGAVTSENVLATALGLLTKTAEKCDQWSGQTEVVRGDERTREVIKASLITAQEAIGNLDPKRCETSDDGAFNFLTRSGDSVHGLFRVDENRPGETFQISFGNPTKDGLTGVQISTRDRYVNLPPGVQPTVESFDITVLHRDGGGNVEGRNMTVRNPDLVR